MARAISSRLRQAAFDQETDEVFAYLITLSHPSLEESIRVTDQAHQMLDSGVRGVISREQEFVHLPFELVLPGEDEDQTPRAQLQIDNVSGEIVKAIRSIRSPATVLIEIILLSQPDQVEISLFDLELRNVTYDALTVQGDLVLEMLENEPFPAGRITPSGFGGVF